MEDAVDIARPVGEIDLLVRIYEAGMHPVAQGTGGNLRLLKSRYGSGYLLDWSHKIVNGEELMMSEQAYQMTRATQSSKWTHLTRMV